ncbi:MAG: M23 family metallopeptidase [Chloroflexi bacterium]|nr:M23 family metallopeptidase [Chloroflexota bacterium]
MRERDQRATGAGRRALVAAVTLLAAALVAGAAAAAWISQRGEERAPEPVAVRHTLAGDRDRAPAATAAPASPPRATVAPTVAAARPAAAEAPSRAAAPAPPSQASAEASPDRVAAPAEPPEVAVEPAVVGNGEAMLVSVATSGAAFATLRYRGEAVPLVAEPDRFWGVVGVPIAAGPGPARLSVEIRTASGRLTHVAETGYEVVLRDRPVDHLELSEEMMGALLSAEAVEEESRLRAGQFSTFDPSPRWEEPFRIPAEGVITTDFGSPRSINDGAVSRLHTGTDFANARGTPVIATAPGRVAWVGEMPIRGRSVIIDHGAGVLSGYHHLDSEEVAVGHTVEGGQVIGAMGSTGLSTGPHLHWEITVWGVNVDPLVWTERRYRP